MSRRYTIRYVSPAGEEWKISDSEWIAGLKHAGISGLIGQRDARLLQAIGAPGNYHAGHQIPGMTGELTVLVRAGADTTALDEWVRLRKAFNTDADNEGSLFIDSGDEELETRVRLNGYVSEPEFDNTNADAVNDVKIPLAADSGIYLGPLQTGTGRVSVTNDGDVPLTVELSWTGAGGFVLLPSGGGFELPPVTDTRIMRLNSKEGCVVTDALGVIDRPLWEQLRRKAMPEAVPVGVTRSFSVPTGVTVQWRKGVLDPWS